MARWQGTIEAAEPDVQLVAALLLSCTALSNNLHLAALLLLQAMARWQGTIEAAEADVERILAEEREEAALRRAEMEANKAAVRAL
jgi:hypothetical protein